MDSIFWLPLGFPVTIALPPRSKLTAACFCSDVITKIAKKSHLTWQIHPDN
jgi:hypothetical protein